MTLGSVPGGKFSGLKSAVVVESTSRRSSSCVSSRTVLRPVGRAWVAWRPPRAVRRVLIHLLIVWFHVRRWVLAIPGKCETPPARRQKTSVLCGKVLEGHGPGQAAGRGWVHSAARAATQA